MSPGFRPAQEMHLNSQAESTEKYETELMLFRAAAKLVMAGLVFQKYP